MRVRVGTSGYSYKEWKGTFYPHDLPAAKMLPFYAERFDSVEINNTFYRMPDAKVVEKWGEQVPDGFTFVLKAPQRITHQKGLAGAKADVAYFFKVAETLGEKLGPVRFLLPPAVKKDAAMLRDFLAALPPARQVAFDFRHDSWCDDEIYELLRGHDAALCLADTDETTNPDAVLIPTATWGYLRLRRTEYSEDDLGAWARRVEGQGWETAYVFFKHEDEGRGPAFAVRFRKRLVAGDGEC